MQVLNASFRRVASMVAAGHVAPLPIKPYAFNELHTALRQFAHARHVGKIVVRMPRADQRGAWSPFFYKG